MTFLPLFLCIMFLPFFQSFRHSLRHSSALNIDACCKNYARVFTKLGRQKKDSNDSLTHSLTHSFQKIKKADKLEEPDWLSEGYFDVKESKASAVPVSSAPLKKGNGNIKMKALAPQYNPRGENQKLYVEYLNDPNIPIVLGYGPAGSGKTLFACYTAVKELKAGNIQKIIMTRPLISVDKEDIGFLPGSLSQKMDPWTRPIFDILLEFFSQRDIDTMLNSGVIEISPLAYMRGRTFKKSFIIADEMQNSSPNQMLMMTTRIGDGTKMVITGDLKQSDRMEDNGLLDFITRIKRHENSCREIKYVEMAAGDIERSKIVSTILAMYEDPTTEVAAMDATALSALERAQIVSNILEMFENTEAAREDEIVSDAVADAVVEIVSNVLTGVLTDASLTAVASLTPTAPIASLTPDTSVAPIASLTTPDTSVAPIASLTTPDTPVASLTKETNSKKKSSFGDRRNYNEKNKYGSDCGW